jgi:hypothetical protein
VVAETRDGKPGLLMIFDAGTVADAPDSPVVRRHENNSGRWSWNQLDFQEAKQVLDRLSHPLFAGSGWRWDAGDLVTVSLPPFDQTPLRGKFNSETGQFSFDTVQAIQSINDQLWAVTPAGILLWQGANLADQMRETVENSATTSRAQFIQALDGSWYVLMHSQQGKPVGFFTLNDVWTKPADLQAAVNTVREAQPWLHHGITWQVHQGECNPQSDQNSFGRIFHIAAPQRRTFERAELGVDRTWGFENVQTICDVGGAAVLGTPIGLRSWMKANGGQTAGWEFLRTPPVARIGAEDHAVHVRHSNDEELVYDLAATALPRTPARRFAERDRLLLDGARWQCEKSEPDSPPSWRLKFSPAADFQAIAFRDDRGRFDFDSVDDVAHIGEDVLMASNRGFLRRKPSDKGGFSVIDGLPPMRDADTPGVFDTWRDGRRQTFIEHPRGQIHVIEGEMVMSLDKAESQAVLDMAGSWVAGDDVWDIRRKETGLAYRFRPARSLAAQPVEFREDLGGFTFDFFREVLLVLPQDSGNAEVILATGGGIGAYTLTGSLVSLHADLDNDGSADSVRHLWHTTDGPLAEVQHRNSTRYYRRENRETWTDVPRDRALTLIREATSAIDDYADGWKLAFDPYISTGADAIHLYWQREPLKLLPGPEARFEHDQILSAEWHDDHIWLAADGGVLKMKFDVSNGELVGAPGHHLWTQAFAEGGNIFSIRALAVGPDQRQLVCRGQSGSDHMLWYLNHAEMWLARPDGDAAKMADAADSATLPSNTSRAGSGEILPLMSPEQAHVSVSWQDVDETVLIQKPDYWTWTLSAPGKIAVKLDENTFHIPSGGDYPLFSGGTFSFWNIDSAVANATPIAGYATPTNARDGSTETWSSPAAMSLCARLG